MTRETCWTSIPRAWEETNRLSIIFKLSTLMVSTLCTLMSLVYKSNRFLYEEPIVEHKSYSPKSLHCLAMWGLLQDSEHLGFKLHHWSLDVTYAAHQHPQHDTKARTNQKISCDQHSAWARPKLSHNHVTLLLVHITMLWTEKKPS